MADAQLALARAYDFPSWPKLRQHLLLVQPWRRNPHRVGEQAEPADELVRLACLTYGADDGVRPTRAAALLEADPELGGSSVYAAAATGSVAALRAVLADDPAAVDREGGPYQWTPLLYLCFSRIPDAPPDRSSLACARLLLEAGADPNAGFLWEGLAPPFTALTGAFGGGEDRANQPPHPQALRPGPAAARGRGRSQRRADPLQPEVRGRRRPSPAAVRVRAGSRRRRPVAPPVGRRPSSPRP